MGRKLHWIGAPAGAALTALLGSIAVGAAWDTCEVGVNRAAASGAVLASAVPLFLVSLLLWGGCTALARRGHPWPAMFLAALGSLALCWAHLAILHDPGGYPSPYCREGNVPGWWPGWLPL